MGSQNTRGWGGEGMSFIVLGGRQAVPWVRSVSNCVKITMCYGWVRGGGGGNTAEPKENGVTCWAGRGHHTNRESQLNHKQTGVGR